MEKKDAKELPIDEPSDLVFRLDGLDEGEEQAHSESKEGSVALSISTPRPG